MLKEKRVIRSQCKINQARGALPQASKPREVIQMDSMDLVD